MASSAVPELIPREVLFGNPIKASPRLSPDGRRIAYLAPVDNVLNVWVGTVGASDDRPVTRDTDRGIRIYFWAEDGRHLLYLQDVGGNENWRLYAVNPDGDTVQDMTPFENVQVQVLEHDKRFPSDLLICMNLENEAAHDVYRLDLTTGKLEMVAKNPGHIADWLADASLAVRCASAATPEGGFDLLVREAGSGEWRALVSWEPDDSLTSAPLAFTEDGQSLYLKDSRGVNASRLIRMEIATGAFEVIAEDSQYDVGDVLLHPDTRAVQMVSYFRARQDWAVLDPRLEPDVSNIRSLHPGDFSIVSRDQADRNWLVAFTADNGPVSYYVYDRAALQSTFLFDNQPALKQYSLAPMEPVSFPARDGLTLHGYLSCPPGQARKNLPLVLNVHGGPWARDLWGLDPEAQWLANRGYACLQVNFRGSTGYGKAFLNAGDREWGGKMHLDLADAVRWAVAEGIADPGRVAIYGGSYGGYAALVGATFTPDLFCCAVDIVGPSSLETLIRSIPPYWSTFLATFHKRVGNPDTEKEFLEARSPLFKVDRIRIPMLIAQGANDPRVKQAESERIVAAMEAKGIDYEYLLFPDEGHGFAKPENRLRFYAAAERFLARHLGGRCEAGDEPA
ncbi:MAG: S9 family peptidase [Armatimonadetes bacterium]|nr:S9 family peptidase [Armatimonadota bacterium]